MFSPAALTLEVLVIYLQFFCRSDLRMLIYLGCTWHLTGEMPLLSSQITFMSSCPLGESSHQKSGPNGLCERMTITIHFSWGKFLWIFEESNSQVGDQLLLCQEVIRLERRLSLLLVKQNACTSQQNSTTLHSRSLTARPWKMMVGRRSFPFGALQIFRGKVAVKLPEE